MKPLFLKIYQNEQLVQVKQFRDHKMIALGSGEVDVQLEGLALLQAVIQREDHGRIVLKVIEPGVFVNGQPITEHVLSSPDVFQVANYKIEFFKGFPTNLTSTATQPPLEQPPVHPVAPQVPVAPPPPPAQTHHPTPPVPSQPPPSAHIPVQHPVPPTQPPSMQHPTQPSVSPHPPQSVPPPIPSSQPTSTIPVQQQPQHPVSPVTPQAPVVPAPPTPPSFRQHPSGQTPPVQPQPPVTPAAPQVPIAPQVPVAPLGQEQTVIPEPPASVQKQEPLIIPKPIEAPPVEDTFSKGDLNESTVTQTFVPGESLEIPEAPPCVDSKPDHIPVKTKPVFKDTQQATGILEESDKEPFQKGRKKRTFALPSDIKDINERIKPEGGSVVQVVVAWNERILNTLYFDNKSTVRVGGHPKNDIVLPVFGDAQDSHPLIKIRSLASLFVTYEMRGVVVKGQQRISFDEMIQTGVAKRSDKGFTIELQQKELARIDFENGICIFVKYVAPSPKPLIGPFFALTARELNGLVMALGTSVIMAIFFLISYETVDPNPEKDEELERKAIFVYKPPPRPAIDPIPVQKPKPIKVTPKKPRKVKPQRVKLDMAKKTPKPKPQVKRAMVKKKSRVRNAQKGRVAKRANEGKRAGEIKKRTKSNRKVVTTGNVSKQNNLNPRAGGGGRSGKAGRSGRRAEGRKKDVSKSGLLGVFAKGGTQDQLRTALDGAGVVGGAARSARGSGGSAGGGSGSGFGPGGGLAALGKGGQGESTYGIAGVKTKGSGLGVQGYGTGALGGKHNVTIMPGGEGESFVGMIDKDAVRRVVRRNLNQLKNCYERLAQRKRSSAGKVELGWDIYSGGRARNVKVITSQIKDQKMLNCMKLRLASWRFPDPPEGVIGEVKFPFVFALQRQ